MASEAVAGHPCDRKGDGEAQDPAEYDEVVFEVEGVRDGSAGIEAEYDGYEGEGQEYGVGGDDQWADGRRVNVVWWTRWWLGIV